MKTSSSVQLDLGLPQVDAAWATSDTGVRSSRSNAVNSSATSLPNFDNYDKVLYAITAQRAGRLNAANISQQEHDMLLSERARLIEKKFSGGLSRREEHKLEYVRWSLDRIEDARHGEAVDALDSAVMRYERFMEDLTQLEDDLAAVGPKRK
jgi:hypothetical protein